MSHSFSASFVGFKAAFEIPAVGRDGSSTLASPSADVLMSEDATLVGALNVVLVVGLDAPPVFAIGGGLHEGEQHGLAHHHHCWMQTTWCIGWG